MESELFTESDASDKKDAFFNSDNLQQQFNKNDSSDDSSTYSYHKEATDKKIKKKRSTEKVLKSAFKRTRTEAVPQKAKMDKSGQNNLNNLSVGGLDLILMTRINRQNSNIVNRDFVIEEDFEEDLTSPLSRRHKNGTKHDFSDAVISHLQETHSP